MISEGALDLFCFSFFAESGGDTISYRRRGSGFFFLFVGPKTLE